MRPRVHKVAVIEDHLLQRKYAVALVQAQADLRVVFSGEDLPTFTSWLATADREAWPDLIMLDLMVDRRPDPKPETVRQLVVAGFRVVLFSALASPPLARQMIRAGAHGLIGKQDSETKILAALRTIIAGEEWVSPDLAALIAQDAKQPKLSDQEERALILYASGLSIEAVSTSIGVKTGTAKKYLQRVREKYAAVDRPLASRLDWNRVAAEDGYLVRAK